PKPALVPTDRGTVVYMGKYEFKAPVGWKLIRNLTGGDFEVGFLNIEKGEFPSQTTMFYDEEPYGSSRDLETRARQYSVFFLAGRGMSMAINKMEKGEVAGRPALVVRMEGENPYRKEKARSVVYFFKTGDYVVTLACTQWRPMKGSFDPKPFQGFEDFAKSFKYLKPTFYEEIEERIKRIER
ncbi:MAG: hypothetical protein NTY64_22055, partial [Deltaproteobacteria bacterium]|nr:hypothetical protein [Deltaproteobacteria bacterium]